MNKLKNALNVCRSIMAVLCFVLLIGNSNSNAQVFDWAINIGGSGNDRVSDVAVDQAGNVYVTGAFQHTVDFDPGPGVADLVSPGGWDIFIAKYDRNGNYIWAQNMGNGGWNGSSAIDIDEAGNVHITGVFVGTMDFDPGARVANLVSSGGGVGGNDIFVAKYDSSGNYIWAIGLGGTGEDAGNSLAVDDAGNVYVTGKFEQTADFDPGAGVANLQSLGPSSVFIAKYDSSGRYVWAGGTGGLGGTNMGVGVTVDEAGNVYITGAFVGTADFDLGTGVANLISAGNWDIFLAKYDSSGKYIWAKGIGGPDKYNYGRDLGYGIAVDNSSNIYITGYFTDTVDFDPGPDTFNLFGSISERVFGPGIVIQLPVPTIFAAKFDSAGSFVWARSMNGNSATSDDRGQGVAVDRSGNLYVTGFFSGTIDFDPGPDTVNLISAGGNEAFIAKYDQEGNYMWAGSIGSSDHDHGYAVALDGSGNVYAVGDFSATVDFDPGPGVTNLISYNNSARDGFVLKLACNDTSSSYIEVSTCQENYTFNNIDYKVRGIYSQVFPNISGCDSSVMLDLSFYKIEPFITTEEFVLSVSGTYITYQWFKDGIPIPGATGSTYHVTENGSYTVMVTNEEGCEGTSDVYPVTNVSVEDINSLSPHIRIYPNPTDDMVNISSPVNINVHLCSIDGRVLSYRENVAVISLKEWTNGIYFLKITDKEGRLLRIEKIVKQ